MSDVTLHDTFTVTNGPEDGAEFLIMEPRVTIGSDPSASVTIRVDRTVEHFHVTATPTGKGFRVRAVTGAPVWVNGKRVRRPLSRRMESGDVLKVGHTELVLQCAKDGVSTGGRPLIPDNDLVWMMGRTLGLLRYPLLWMLPVLRSVGRSAKQHWKMTSVAVFLLLYFGVPPFREFVWDLYYRVKSRIL